MKKSYILRLVLTAMLLALGLVLPFLTGQIPEIGGMLLPLHLPAPLCGLACGWPRGLALGFILPLLRSLLFGMPPLMPTAVCMAFEMAAYGAAAGLLYKRLGGKTPAALYASLIGAMLVGRLVWGVASWLIYSLFTQRVFTLTVFWVSGFVNAWPGIVLQLILIPAILLALQKARLIPLTNE